MPLMLWLGRSRHNHCVTQSSWLSFKLFYFGFNTTISLYPLLLCSVWCAMYVCSAEIILLHGIVSSFTSLLVAGIIAHKVSPFLPWLRPLSKFHPLTMSSNYLSETAPLLATHRQDTDELTPCESNPKVRGVIWGALTLLFLVALVLLVGFQGIFGDPFAGWLDALPKDPTLAALAILDKAPVIVRDSLVLWWYKGLREISQDGHIGGCALSCSSFEEQQQLIFSLIDRPACVNAL